MITSTGNHRLNPVSAFLGYRALLRRGRVGFPTDRINETLELPEYGRFTVFRQIALTDSSGAPMVGNAVFQVVFHSPSLSVDTVIRRTDLTMPFFAGLPGFCSKEFMVNREDRVFSGRYEWSDVDAALDYSRSYAVAFMRRRSSPKPLSFRVIEKATGCIVGEDWL